jgi:hypothetical protein
MLNLAGAEYDFGRVLYAVLEECEHLRPSIDADPTVAAERLHAAAAAKLAEIAPSYGECGGTPAYWEELTREVMDNALPQYTAVAIEKNRLERASYDIWRGGDPLARGAFALGGLTLGGIMVKLPFIPIWEDSFAFALACGGLFYPDLKRLYYDHRHARVLNRLITQADRYQKDRQLHYVSGAELDAVLRPERQDEGLHVAASEAAHSVPGAPVASHPVAAQDAPASPPPAVADRGPGGPPHG